MTRRKVDERGVYAVFCSGNRAYVGSSNYIHHRWIRHRIRLRGGWHPNRLLQAAWIALGEDAFRFVALEIVGPDGDLFAAEQRWIDRLQAFGSGYNLAPLAGSTRGVRVSPEARAQMADRQRGRKHTSEACARRSAALKAFYADPAQRAKRSAAMIGRRAGEKSATAKLSRSDVAAIRDLALQGLTHRVIGARFGVSRSAVGRIVNGQSWATSEVTE